MGYEPFFAGVLLILGPLAFCWGLKGFRETSKLPESTAPPEGWSIYNPDPKSGTAIMMAVGGLATFLGAALMFSALG